MVINHTPIYIVGSYLMKNKIVMSIYRQNMRVSICPFGYRIALHIHRQRSGGIRQAMNSISIWGVRLGLKETHTFHLHTFLSF